MVSRDTSQSLLGRLRASPCDERSWNEFVDRYGVMILQWCRNWGLQPADAEDVTQSVLVQLAKQMRTFEYDPNGRFRSWLRTLAYRAWCDFLTECQKREKSGRSQAIVEMLSSERARGRFLESIEEEVRRNLMDDAMQIVRARVQPGTWQAFEATALLGQKGEVVAQKLGTSVASVYVARSKVTKMIREQVARLDGGT